MVWSDQQPAAPALAPRPDNMDEAELPQATTDRRSLPPRRIDRLAAPLTVGLGGALGAILRYRVSLWSARHWGDQFPWGTLLINVTGCLIIGFYLTLVTEGFAGRPLTRLFVTTGILGGYTTFSTFAYETVSLIDEARYATAMTYLAASLALSIIAVLAGRRAAKAI